jgi:hypothetical protein
MPGRAARVHGEPLFDIRAFGRADPADRMRIRADIEQLMRTVRAHPCDHRDLRPPSRRAK